LIAPVDAVQLAVLSSVLRRVRKDLCNIYEIRFRKKNVVRVHEGWERMWSARGRKRGEFQRRKRTLIINHLG
jgi:hypothetical protein